MRRPYRWIRVCLTVFVGGAVLPAAGARADVVHPQPYDLLYVRAPYFGPGPEGRNSIWPGKMPRRIGSCVNGITCWRDWSWTR